MGELTFENDFQNKHWNDWQRMFGRWEFYDVNAHSSTSIQHTEHSISHWIITAAIFHKVSIPLERLFYHFYRGTQETEGDFSFKSREVNWSDIETLIRH